MSKALMEKVMVARSRSNDPDKQVFCGTRYGNVMASRGSVIPLFVEQLKAGKPLTITDPNMKQFLHLVFIRMKQCLLFLKMQMLF